MDNYVQNKEKTISLKKNKNVQEVFERIYNYVFARLKKEKVIKNKADMSLGIFKGFVLNDQSKAKIQLLDANRTIIQIPILFASTINLNLNDTVVLLSWDDEKKYYVLGKYEMG